MEILYLWLGTSLACYGLNVANAMLLVKDFVDRGYKFNIANMQNMLNNIKSDIKMLSFVQCFIPFYNFYQLVNSTLKLKNSKPFMINQFKTLGFLENLTQEETIEYQEHPTFINAIKICSLGSTNINNIVSLDIDENNNHSKIIFKKGESIDDIKIIKVDGYACLLNIEEQKKLIDKYYFNENNRVKDDLTNLENNEDNKLIAKSEEQDINNNDFTELKQKRNKSRKSLEEICQQLEKMNNDIKEQSANIRKRK